MTRIGILGGTFDPVHLGHTTSARQTAAGFDLERVLLVLSAYPPHKPDATPAPVEDRLAMLRLAVQDDPLLEVSEVEIRRPGPSYTYDTLVELARDHPADALYLILGLDAYDLVDSWHHPQGLLELANVIVTSRPGEPEREGPPLPPVAARSACCYDSRIGCYVHQSGHVLHSYQIDGLDISASRIREVVARAAAAERDEMALVEEVSMFTARPVAQYIVASGLYRILAGRGTRRP